MEFIKKLTDGTEVCIAVHRPELGCHTYKFILRLDMGDCVLFYRNYDDPPVAIDGEDFTKLVEDKLKELKPHLKEYEQMVEARIKKYNELKEQERRGWLIDIENTIASVVSNMDIKTEIKELKEQVAKLVLIEKKCGWSID